MVSRLSGIEDRSDVRKNDERVKGVPWHLLVYERSETNELSDRQDDSWLLKNSQ